MNILQDIRRVLPPVDTVPLKYQDSDEDVVIDQTAQRTNAIRQIFINQGVVANASGSAYLEVGDIKLQCSVYGPKPIRGSFTQQADLSVEAKLSTIGSSEPTSDDSVTLASSVEKDITSFVQTSITPSIVLSQYPKSAINIMITVISADIESKNLKSLFAAATNVASLALVDAGIALYDMVTSASVLLKRADGQEIFYYDPELPREADDLDAVISFMTSQDASNIVGVWIDGEKISSKDLTDINAHAQKVAGDIRALFNGVLLQGFREKEQQAINQ